MAPIFKLTMVRKGSTWHILHCTILIIIIADKESANVFLQFHCLAWSSPFHKQISTEQTWQPDPLTPVTQWQPFSCLHQNDIIVGCGYFTCCWLSLWLNVATLMCSNTSRLHFQIQSEWIFSHFYGSPVSCCLLFTVLQETVRTTLWIIGSKRATATSEWSCSMLGEIKDGFIISAWEMVQELKKL